MKPGPTHVALLNAIYEGLKQSGKWPPFSYVDRVLDRQGLDTEKLIQLLPPDLSSIGPGRFNNDAEEVSLTIAGLSYCTGAESDLALILKAIQLATKIEQEHQPTLDPNDRPSMRGEQLSAMGADEAAIQRVYLLIRFEPWTAGSGSGPQGVEIWIGRAVRRFRGVQTVEEYLERRADFFGQAARIPPAVRLGLRPGTVLGLEQEPPEEKDGKYIFVIMPLKTEFDDLYKTIRTACAKFPGVTFDRADDWSQTGRITDQIVAALKAAHLIIADITEQNPNVMYELGYAHALGKRVIVLNAGQGSPFDVADYRQILYAATDLLSAEESLTRFVQTALKIEPNR